jgi:hypothetical protein
MIWLLPPPLSRLQVVSFPQSSFVSLVKLLTEKGGGEKEGAKSYERRPGPLKSISYSLDRTQHSTRAVSGFKMLACLDHKVIN